MGAEAERPGGAPRIALAGDLDVVRGLFREYLAPLGDVAAHLVGFEAEVQALPAGYDFILLADAHGGCVAVRDLGDGICEMKRLYVSPSARGTGAGRALASTAIEHARSRGYRAMRLDTLPAMRAAQALYESLGFIEIPPYWQHPVADARFMELDLRLPPSGT